MLGTLGILLYRELLRTVYRVFCRVIKMLLSNLDDSGKFHLKRLACDKVNL